MPKKTTGTSSTAKTTNGKAPRARAKTRKAPERNEEAIRIRAYELFLARDGAPGSEMDDWLHAERELVVKSVGAGRRSAPNRRTSKA
jgi:Protein of unknown function (DUF2934)